MCDVACEHVTCLHWLVCLNTWSPAGGTVSAGFEVSKDSAFPVISLSVPPAYGLDMSTQQSLRLCVSSLLPGSLHDDRGLTTEAACPPQKTPPSVSPGPGPSKKLIVPKKEKNNVF